MNESSSRKAHWENIYQTKPLETVSWYQPVPETSLSLIDALNLPKTARIIDIGGGDSLLTDHLLQLGYTHLTVLDISATALKRAQKRLGPLADRVRWIASDVVDFQPDEPFDLWHDRAAFHFLTEQPDIEAYREVAAQAVKPDGHMLVATFSIHGPEKCSGKVIRRYEPTALETVFQDSFRQTGCLETGHSTPGGSVQQFLFCNFKRRVEPSK